MKKISLEIDNVLPQQGSKISIGDRIDGKIVTDINVDSTKDGDMIIITTTSPHLMGLADTFSSLVTGLNEDIKKMKKCSELKRKRNQL